MRLKGYPGWFYSVLLAALGVLIISGVLLLPAALELKLEWQVPWRLVGDQQIGMAAIHAGVAFLTAAMVGALWSVHMRAGWRRRNNHRTGLGLAMLLLLLGITAIGIYYLGDASASVYTSVTHVAGGILFPVLLAVHMVNGWRRRGCS